MANAQAVCTSFKTDLLNGKHAFGASVVRGSTAKDTFNAALYLASGSLGAATAAYSTTSEVSGTNYAAGGVAVTNATAPSAAGTTAIWTPSASIVFTNVTLTTAFDCCLIYNASAVGKNAVSVHTFGAQTITAGTFTLTMPVNDATNALVRLA